MDTLAGAEIRARIRNIERIKLRKRAPIHYRTAVLMPHFPDDHGLLRSSHPLNAAGPNEDDGVSVIIAARNAERSIERTLASVLTQTYRKIDIVVVDDGSVDLTPPIVEAAASRDARIRLFCRSHQGVAAARNFAISQARYGLIAPVDADDLWHPEKLECQVKLLRQSPPETGVIYCWSIGIDDNDVVISAGCSQSVAEGRVLAAMAETNFVGNASAPLIRRRLLEAVGGYDPSLYKSGAQGAEDWKLYLLLAEICDFAVVRRHLVGYRRSPGCMSANLSVMGHSIALVRRWMMDRWPDLAPRQLKRQDYFVNAHFAFEAAGQRRLLQAFRFQARAYGAMPTRLTHPSELLSLGRLFCRAVGLRSLFPRRRRPVSFHQLANNEMRA